MISSVSDVVSAKTCISGQYYQLVVVSARAHQFKLKNRLTELGRNILENTN